jgi:hypothetical protein
MASVPDFKNFPRQAPNADASPLELFQKRLKRLTDGEAPRNVLWVGTDEYFEIPAKSKPRKPRGLAALIANAIYPISVMAAVSLGIIAHGLVLMLRYQIQGLPNANANPDIEMVAQLAMAFALSMVLGHFTGLRAQNFTSLKALGAGLGLLFFHNLVHMYPQVFDILFSKSWVNYVTQHTHAHSMVWRGISFVF